jgi:poly(A) polymerase
MASLSPANSSAEQHGALRLLLARPDVARLLAVLNAAGEEARIVGGAVRDTLMGRTVGDIDFATTVLPEAVMRRATNEGWKAVPTGLAHGTVTVVIDGAAFEITTLRRDVATDGRRAAVAFTRDFAEDALRRDFTINALSLAADGTIHDYGGGTADARSGLVRFMGDPETRIREDYLRILRFFRFHASHGKGAPDAAGLAACAALQKGLDTLSRERVRQEIMKLLMAPGAVAATEAMAQIGLWRTLLPGFCAKSEVLRRLMELERAHSLSSNPIRRLAALLEPGPQPLASFLRLSRKEEAALAAIGQHAGAFTGCTPSISVFGGCLVEAGAESAVDSLLVSLARSGADAATVKAWFETARPLLEEPPVMPFRKLDFAALGIPDGPKRGQFLQNATRRWIEAGLPGDSGQCRAIIAATLAETGG